VDYRHGHSVGDAKGREVQHMQKAILGHDKLAASVDIQALLRRFTVELAPVEGVPRASLFCDFRDFCVTLDHIFCG